MRGIVKRFGSVVANDHVDLDIRAGEVLALLGENGAGKSTLMRVLYGLLPAGCRDASRSTAATVAFTSPLDAMAAGIGMVFQQFSLIPALTVLENLLVACADARRGGRRGAARPCAPHCAGSNAWRRDSIRGAASSDLAVGERQIVELAKVLNLDPRVVILDEPTSVLTPAEAARLHGFVRELAAAGQGRGADHPQDRRRRRPAPIASR